MTTTRIYRFNNQPSGLADCWQKSIASACNLPCFDDDISYVLRELPRYERKHWVFGYTKTQFIDACRRFKQQARFCCDKRILRWSRDSKLCVYNVKIANMFVFKDQVLFDIRKVN